MAQVERDGVRAQVDLPGHLAVAQALGHQPDDPVLGVGQAVPAEGGPVGAPPVMQPHPRRAQPGPYPCHVAGPAELLVELVRAAEPGHRRGPVAVRVRGQCGILGGRRAGERRRVPAGRPLQRGRVAVHQPAGMDRRRGQVRVARRATRPVRQRLGRLRELRRPGMVAAGQRAAHQQHGGSGPGRGRLLEHRQPELLFEVADVGRGAGLVTAARRGAPHRRPPRPAGRLPEITTYI